MSNTYSNVIQGSLDFPRQKLPESKKDDSWYEKNADYAIDVLYTNNSIRTSYRNKKVNSDLRANIINPEDFKKIINPDQLDLDTIPANFQHIGIENSKINLLVGEYIKRNKDFRAYLSSNDKEGISRKEKELKRQLTKRVTDIITSEDISEEEIERELQEFSRYEKYDFQDIAEITANKILKYEYKKQDLQFLFSKTFEDLLTNGEQVVYCGVLGGLPVMRRVNPMNIYTIGGNSMFIEDADIIIEYGYSSVGQVIDDYWDELEDKDIDYLESNDSSGYSMNALGLNTDISIEDYYGDENVIQLFNPRNVTSGGFAAPYDAKGNIRVAKVCWKTRRKIGKRKYYDEDGEEQFDYVDENYKAREELGEEISWRWVNEWLETTKIGEDIYVKKRPIPYAGKSLVNKSKGTPSYIGSLNSTNDYKVQSLMDIMKPLSYSYDIAYYKRELEIATYKGSFAAINAAMVPSGWEPKEWIRYITVNKFGFLDPTNEILKGPSQGKSAGAFNTLTATNVSIGDPQAIQMYTDLLLDIEQTIGKLAGVTGAREGQIQQREAVGNVERTVAQTSHITEKWFSIDNNFVKRALTKFLECCKYAYKKYPESIQYIMDDMGAEMIQVFDEFGFSEMDVHLSNASDDTMLYQKLDQLSQAAIQNGQAKITDLITISKSESVQEIARKLEESSERIAEEQRQQQQQAEQAQQQMAQMQQQTEQAKLQEESRHKDEDRQLKYAELELKREEALGRLSNENYKLLKEDADGNGIRDDIDLERLEVDRNHKERTVELKERELNEKIRKNKADEAIKRTKTKTQN